MSGRRHQEFGSHFIRRLIRAGRHEEDQSLKPRFQRVVHRKPRRRLCVTADTAKERELRAAIEDHSRPEAILESGQNAIRPEFVQDDPVDPLGMDEKKIFDRRAEFAARANRCPGQRIGLPEKHPVVNQQQGPVKISAGPVNALHDFPPHLGPPLKAAEQAGQRQGLVQQASSLRQKIPAVGRAPNPAGIAELVQDAEGADI